MFNPTDFAPASNAPRLVASIIPWSSAGYNDGMLLGSGLIGIGHERAEFTSHIVKVAFCFNTLSDCEATFQLAVGWSSGQRCKQRFHFAACGSRLANSRAAENDNRLVNLMVFKQEFRLEIIDLQAHATHAILRQKVDVDVSPPIAGAIQDRLHPLQSLGVFFGCLRLLPGQGIVSPRGMGGARNVLRLCHGLSDRCWIPERAKLQTKYQRAYRRQKATFVSDASALRHVSF